MSITFAIARPYSPAAQDPAYQAWARSTCPACGTGITGQGPDCSTCLGYGGDQELERLWQMAERARTGPVLNVSNYNGAALLRALDLGNGELWGEAPPAQVRRCIALARSTGAPAREARAAAPATKIVVSAEGVDERPSNFHDQGCPAEQLETYLTKLEALCQAADEEGCSIRWD